MYKERQEKLIHDLLQEENVDYILCMNPMNIYYYTGFHTNPHERFFLLCIDLKEQKTILLLPSLDVNAAKDVANVDLIMPVADNENGYQKLSSHIREGQAVFAIEKNYVTVDSYEELLRQFGEVSVKDIEPFILSSRVKKTAGEIEKVKKAIQITEAALHNLLPKIQLQMTENEVKALLEYELKRLGAERIAFETMVLTGANSALPHGIPGERPIQKGDFLLFDFGVYVDHYCSDITRTFVIGEASEEQRKVYETVRQANETAIKAVKMGIPLKNIDLAAREVIEAANYGPYFTHRTGHGLGLDVHEAPSIHNENEEKIKEGLLFTIEPGIYMEGFGGVRIEDNIYVDENGEVELLTSFPKELTIIEAN